MSPLWYLLLIPSTNNLESQARITCIELVRAAMNFRRATVHGCLCLQVHTRTEQHLFHLTVVLYQHLQYCRNFTVPSGRIVGQDGPGGGRILRGRPAPVLGRVTAVISTFAAQNTRGCRHRSMTTGLDPLRSPDMTMVIHHYKIGSGTIGRGRSLQCSSSRSLFHPKELCSLGCPVTWTSVSGAMKTR
jgi:hypothetical protein